MDRQYVDAVSLLLGVAPVIFESPRFALKGGTALNLFVQDLPRLSVDIDVVFTDHAMEREPALIAIGDDLQTAKAKLDAWAIRPRSAKHKRVTRPSCWWRIRPARSRSR